MFNDVLKGRIEKLQIQLKLFDLNMRKGLTTMKLCVFEDQDLITRGP